MAIIQDVEKSIIREYEKINKKPKRMNFSNVRLEPHWCLAQNAIHQFDDRLTAIRAVAHRVTKK